MRFKNDKLFLFIFIDKSLKTLFQEIDSFTEKCANSLWITFSLFGCCYSECLECYNSSNGSKYYSNKQIKYCILLIMKCFNYNKNKTFKILKIAQKDLRSARLTGESKQLWGDYNIKCSLNLTLSMLIITMVLHYISLLLGKAHLHLESQVDKNLFIRFTPYFIYINLSPPGVQRNYTFILQHNPT